jgi:hypothetical protein
VGYLDDIAAMRAERQGRELYDQLQQIQRDHAENLRMRDEAQGSGDRESWNYHDRECEQLEQEYARIAPPQQPQLPPAIAEFVSENGAFFDRYGQQAWAALDAAVGYATRPFNPQSRNLNSTGMGVSVNSPEFKEAITSLFEMYARDLGMTYDKNERTLTPDEAAAMSGVSAREYNKQARAMYEAGADAPTRQSQQWRRTVG